MLFKRPLAFKGELWSGAVLMHRYPEAEENDCMIDQQRPEKSMEQNFPVIIKGEIK